MAVNHPDFEEVLVHESGYIVEKNVGFKTIAIPFTKEKFKEMYCEYKTADQQLDFLENQLKEYDFIKRECI